MIFKPLPCKSRWEGIFVISWVLLIDSLLLTWMSRRDTDWLSFLMVLALLASLPLLARLVYRTWGSFNLSYRLDRDALHIHWAATHQIVPLRAIRRVIRSGKEIGGWTPLYWPAPFVRTGKGQRARRLERFATRPLPGCLLLETDEAIFALSPAHGDAFLDALETYNQLGPIQPLALERRRPLLGAENVFDGLSLGLAGLSVLGLVLLFGILMIQYPSLPDRLVFHYNSEGVPDSIRAKSSLFMLPIIGLLAFVINGAGGVFMAYRQQRLGSYLLWGGTLTVQLLVLLALLSLIA
jgi:hypothetical protein